MTVSTEQLTRDAYLETIKRAVTNYHYLGGESSFEQFRCVNHYDLERGEWMVDPDSRPLTLLRKGQLDLIERAVAHIAQRNVAGDLMEAGIWRGGAIVLMRALLNAYGLAGRKVIAADSFTGIPLNTRATNDPVDQWSDRWVASLDEVRRNIARFGLLDDRIEFVPGLFADSLKGFTGRRLALLRLDSDSYDSVETSIEHLYPMLSPGGVIIIDDWHLPGCRMAVEDYRARYAINDPVQEFDANAFWTKRHEHGAPPSTPRA